ncbi:7000_t:CDS:2 [Funneliformis geosporum]|nr:7000_t:CDS:2 [Funneliformis geosporum]
MSPIEKNNFNVDFYCSGSYGVVSCANWKGSETIMALKLSHNLSIKEVVNVVNEIKMQREVDYHANIIKFYVVSKSDLTNKYLLVMEYANALQLANAVAYMHNEGIIHCDLHAQNVLVHQNNIKLAGFGLSRKITDVSDYSTDVFGVSDVYSVGVLLWQISSGHKPFYSENIEYDANLIMKIKAALEKKYYGDAFELFLSTSENNYSIAQVYLANCYKTGFGTEINYDHAFNWMQKAVESESIYGQLNIGIYYEQAANNGNLCGLYNLSRCYELGIGIEKDENKAFEINRKFHETELVNGIYRIRICYYFGIGTDINKKEAFEICKDLAKRGHNNAQSFLGYLYDQDENSKKMLFKKQQKIII